MNWKSNKLSEISLIGDGAHASLKRTNSGIPYLTAKNITKSGIDYSNMDYISEETYNKYFKKASNALTQPKENDVLYSIIGSIGGVYVVRDEKIGISSSVAIFRSNDNIVLPKYLAYFLKSPLFESQIQAIKSGVAQSFMSLGKLGTVSISYPDNILYQNKLVKILSTYDNLIENNQKQIKLLEEAAQRLYKEWFVDLRFPGHESTKIIDGIPEGWKKTIIGEYLKVKSGYAFKSSWWQSSGNPVVKIKNIDNNTIDFSSIDYVSPEHTLKTTDFKLNKGDIVIAMTGATIGKIGIIPEIKNLYTNQRVGKIFPNKELTNPTPFVFCFYLQESILKQIVAISSSSSAQPNISGKQLESFEVITNIETINKFCDFTQPLFDKINMLYKQIQLLKQARDYLLPKLISGELEV